MSKQVVQRILHIKDVIDEVAMIKQIYEDRVRVCISMHDLSTKTRKKSLHDAIQAVTAQKKEFGDSCQWFKGTSPRPACDMLGALADSLNTIRKIEREALTVREQVGSTSGTIMYRQVTVRC